jgi:hypothetical protein
MHEKSLDVCLEVVRIQYQDMKRMKIRGRWWNLGYSGEPFNLNNNLVTVEIQSKDFKAWHDIQSTMMTKRTAPGRPNVG